jgi:hypothetical protein
MCIERYSCREFERTLFVQHFVVRLCKCKHNELSRERWKEIKATKYLEADNLWVYPLSTKDINTPPDFSSFILSKGTREYLMCKDILVN